MSVLSNSYSFPVIEEGKYDWSHIAYSIWPDRILEKCKIDKSLAITHDLENIYDENND